MESKAGDREVPLASPPGGRGSPAVLLRFALEIAAEALDRAGIAWAGLKGIDLAYRVYADPAERAMSDLDLLVAPADLGRAVEALSRAGLAADRDEAGHHRRFRCAIAEGLEVSVELHHDLFDPPGLLPVDVADLISRAPPVAVGSRAMRVLPPAEAWVHVAAHFAWSDAGAGDAARTRRDLALLAAKTTPAEVLEVARRWRLERPIAEVSRALGWEDPGCAALRPGLPGPRRLLAAWLVRRRHSRSGLPVRGEASLVRVLLAPSAGLALRLAWRIVRRRR